MALLSFDESAVFPKKIAFGYEGGPGWFTTVTQTAGGQEQRNINWENPIHKYRVAHEFVTQAEIDELFNFFNARRGRAIGFRFRDWRDYCTDMVGYTTYLQTKPAPAVDTLPAAGVLTASSMTNTATGLLVGDGVTTTFQLVKTYPATGSGTAYQRPLKKPVNSDTVRVYLDAVEQTITTHYTLDTTTGIVTFLVAPGAGVVPTHDSLFEVPCRFDTDEMSSSLDDFNLSTWRNVGILEIRV